MAQHIYSRFDVVQAISKELLSSLQDDEKRGITWQDFKRDLQSKFANDIQLLARIGECEPDGSDLIKQAVETQVPSILADTLNRLENAIVSAVKSADRSEDKDNWGEVRENILRDNALAIGLLSELGKSKHDGSDLIKQAVEKQVPEVLTYTLNRLENAILSAVKSADRSEDKDNWDEVSENILRDNTLAIGLLSELGKCKHDGSDLIKQAAERQVPSILADTLNRLENAIVSAVKSADRSEDKDNWGEVRENILRDNAFMIGLLSEVGKSKRDGTDLIKQAVEKQIPSVLESTLNRLENAIVSAVKSADRSEDKDNWGEVRENILRDNAFMIDLLSELGKSKPDGTDLIKQAVEKQVPEVLESTLNRLENAIVSAVKSADRSEDKDNWGEVRENMLRDNVFMIGLLSEVGKSKPDGSDLIKQAVEKQVSEVRKYTLNKMQSYIVDSVENASSNRLLWSKVRDNLKNDNTLAIGLLSELGECDHYGDGLIERAKDNESYKVTLEYDTKTLPGRTIVYIRQNRVIEPPPPRNWLVRLLRAIWVRTISGGGEQSSERKWLPRLLSAVNWTRAIIGLIVVLLALLGITLSDLFTIPCDIWPFSLSNRCS